MLGCRVCADVQNIRTLHGSNIASGKCYNGNGFACARDEFHFEGFSAFVNMHNRPNVAALEMIFSQVFGKHNRV